MNAELESEDQEPEFRMTGNIADHLEPNALNYHLGVPAAARKRRSTVASVGSGGARSVMSRTMQNFPEEGSALGSLKTPRRKQSRAKTKRSRLTSQDNGMQKVPETYRVQTADHVTDEIKRVEDGAENYEQNDRVIRFMRHQVFQREKKQKLKAEQDERARISQELALRRRKRYAFSQARREEAGMLVAPDRGGQAEK